MNCKPIKNFSCRTNFFIFEFVFGDVGALGVVDGIIFNRVNLEEFAADIFLNHLRDNFGVALRQIFYRAVDIIRPLRE